MKSRLIFLSLVVLLIAIFVLKTAFHMAGMALRLILIIAAILFAIGWITRKVGTGK